MPLSNMVNREAVKICVIFSAYFLVSYFVGCKKQLKDVENSWQVEQKTLSIGNGREPVTLDPHKAASWADLRVIEGLYEGLTVIHPETKEILGGVAESWVLSDDGKTWRFKIRENAKWSNGITITAHDFVLSAKRILGPEFGSDIVVHFLYSVKNAEAYHLGQLDSFDEVGVFAESNTVLVIEVDFQNPAFLTQLSYFFPVSSSGFEDDEFFDGRYQWGHGSMVVSNGAYRLESWVVNEKISLIKNPYYWDHLSVAIDRVSFLPIEDLNTEERAFRSGQIQITAKVPPGKVEWYKRNDPNKLRTDPRLGLFFLQLNQDIAPLSDVKVRLALAKAINREEIVESVLRDGKLPANGIIPASFLNLRENEDSLVFDPAEARRLLSEAGFPGGKGFPQLEFLINTSNTYQALAEAIQYGWKRHLGVEVDIFNQEWKVFLAAVESRDYEVARYGYVPLYPDAYPLFQIFTSEGTENYTGWRNPLYDQLVENARREVNQDDRNRLFRQAESLLLEEVPIIPVFYYNSAYLISPEVNGWKPDLMDRHPLKFVSLDGT